MHVGPVFELLWFAFFYFSSFAFLNSTQGSWKCWETVSETLLFCWVFKQRIIYKSEKNQRQQFMNSRRNHWNLETSSKFNLSGEQRRQSTQISLKRIINKFKFEKGKMLVNSNCFLINSLDLVAYSTASTNYFSCISDQIQRNSSIVCSSMTEGFSVSSQ